MPMYTVCPKCALTLVVTAADLRIGQGHVRCGRCSNVFNALANLTDERQPAGPPPEPRRPPPREEAHEPPASEPPPQREPKSSASDSGPRKGRGGEADAAAADEVLEFDPSSTDLSEVFVEPTSLDDEATGTFESIVLKAEDLESDPESGEIVVDDIESEPRELASQVESTGTHAAPAEPAAPPPPRRDPPPEPSARARAPEAAARPAATDPPPAWQPMQMAEAEDEPAVATDDEEPARDRRMRLARIAACVALGLLLVGQVVHHYRHDLAVDPRLRSVLGSIYGALGVPLVPNWDVGAYEVRQLGAVVGPSNPPRLTVRASVRNGAEVPQPLPLLRVTFQDRYGNRIAARDVPPSAYMAQSASAFLEAGQRIDTEIAFVDPGRNAVGFEIDACLARPGGRIVCAGERSTR